MRDDVALQRLTPVVRPLAVFLWLAIASPVFGAANDYGFATGMEEVSTNPNTGSGNYALPCSVGGSGTAGFVKQGDNPGQTHNANNGGDPLGTSHYAVRLAGSSFADGANCSPTIGAFPWPPLTAQANDATLRFAFHIDAQPTAGTNPYLALLTEGLFGGSPPFHLGCVVTLDTTCSGCDTLAKYHLYYVSNDPALLGNDFGVSETPVYTRHCSHDATIGCAADADCGSGNTCLSCASDGTATGTGCFWPGVELSEHIVTSQSIKCTLRVNGKVEIDPSAVTRTDSSPISDFSIGPITGQVNPGTIVQYFDDLVFLPTARARWGWISTLVPTTDATNPTYDTWACNGGACGLNARAQLMDDYQDATPWVDRDTADEITKGGNLKDQDFTKLTFNSSAATKFTAQNQTISRVEEAVIGHEIAPGTSTLEYGWARCTATSPGSAHDSNCKNDGFERRSVSSALVAQWGRRARNLAPSGGSWQADDVAHLAAHFQTIDVTTAKLDAVAFYVVADRPDSEVVVNNLRDHDKSGGDGTVTILTRGDSMLQGTNSATCLGGTQNGQFCTTESCCSWDYDGKTSGGRCTFPTAGCATNGIIDATSDAACQTCDGTRLSGINGGAGYRCTVTNDDGNHTACKTAGGANGTCDPNSLTCTQNSFATCATDDDCKNFGNCPSAASVFCQFSCPGTCSNTGSACGGNDGCSGGACSASCPFAASWGKALRGNTAANLVRCGVGGERSDTMAANLDTVVGAGSLLDGLDGVFGVGSGVCELDQGSGTKCQCGSAADCKNDGGAGGTCSGGYCTGGDANRVSCGIDGDCAATRLCKFSPPDYVLVMEGVNDSLYWNTDPKLTTVDGAERIISASPTTCVQDSDCVSIDPNSICIGTLTATGEPCSVTPAAFGGVGACTISTAHCTVDADCPVPDGTHAQTCYGGTPGSILPTGACGCTNSNQCPTNFLCTNNRCRLDKTVGCSCCTGVGFPGNPHGDNGTVCNGLCSLPARAVCCDTDADCPSSPKGGENRNFGGICDVSVAGTGACTGRHNCLCAGPASCYLGAHEQGCDALYGRTQEALGTTMVEAFGSVENTTATYGVVPIFITQPYYPRLNDVYDCTSTNTAVTPHVGAADYVSQMSTHLMARSDRFPHVADIRPILASYPEASCYVDHLHFAALCSNAVTRDPGGLADYLGSLNTCAQANGQCIAPYQRSCTADADCNACIGSVQTQTGTPASDISAGGWTPSTGATLWDTIDEVPASDTDYDQSASGPSNDTFEVKLSAIADPDTSTNHVVNYRYAKDASAGRTIGLTVQLRQGASTLIHSQLLSNISNVFTNGSFTLTPTEANTISDYSDLRLRFIANQTGTGAARRARVSYANMTAAAPKHCTTSADCAAGISCVPGHCFDHWAPQKYCMGATGKSLNPPVPCSLSGDCGIGEQCNLRICGCGCSNNNDCIRWFGTGSTCSSGKCKTGVGDPNDACRVAFGADFECLNGKCLQGAEPNDVCSQNGDTCHLE